MIKQLIALVIIAFIAYFTYQQVIKNKTGFNIDTDATFGTPGKAGKKDVDEHGHTDDFWTNNKFKW